MGLLSVVKGLFKSHPVDPSHPSVSVGVGADLDSLSFRLADLSMKSVYDYAAIKAIATHAADIPVFARTIRTEGGKDSKVSLPSDSPIQRIIQRPNDQQPWSDFVEAMVIYMELWGHVHVHIAREKGVPTSLFPVRPDLLSVDPDPTGQEIESYTFTDPLGLQRRISPEDIFQVRHFNPFDPILGLAPSSPAKLSLLADFHSQQFNVVFFGNHALPAVILRTDRPMNKEEKKRLEVSWRNAFGGSARAHGVAVLTSGLDVKTVTPTHRDMEFERLRDANMREILASRGVPPVILGIAKDTTKSNAQEMRHVFLAGTLKPRLNKILAQLNMHVFAPMGVFLEASYDTVMTSALTLHERKMEVRGYWRDGLISRDEARVALGYDPLGGDLGGAYIPITLTGSSAPTPFPSDADARDGREETAALPEPASPPVPASDNIASGGVLRRSLEPIPIRSTNYYIPTPASTNGNGNH